MFPLVILSTVFSLAITSIRLFILSVYGSNLLQQQVAGVLLGAVNEFVVGLLISAVLLYFKRNWTIRVLMFLFLASVIILKIVCFHYEAVFGHLPGADILYYLSELRDLSASIQVHLPLLNIFLEFTGVFGLYFLAWYRFRSYGSTAFPDSIWVTSAIVVTVMALLIQSVPAIVPDKYYQQSREALAWLIKSNFIKKTYDVENIRISRKDIERFLYMHGHREPGPMISDDYPVCRIRTAPADRKKSSRNIIILILESVGYRELYGEYSGKKLMPALQKIAAENLSFSRIYAPGIRSAQALPAIFSGLPSQPFNNYLWTRPLLNFQGFPEKLEQDNYRTVYFHGGDLTFEHQRQYLSETGFDKFDEYKIGKDHKSYGWGYDDRTMFNELKKWISGHENEKRPYLATLFTLSTHDPYVLPTDWTPVFSEHLRVLKDIAKCCEIEGEKNPLTALAETYRFLDSQLSDFYSWYKQNAKDAILIIMGDHPPHIDISGGNNNSYRGRFDVPFIIAGLDTHSQNKYARYTGRTGGQYDIPSTIMYLLGRPPMECDLGVNLLAPEDDWPDDRYVYAMGGDSSQYIQIWHKGMDITFDRTENRYFLNENNGVSRFDKEELKRFLDTVLPMHYYLLENDAYSFHKRSGTRKKIPPVTRPIIISHRGNVHDAPNEKPVENSREAIENVLDSEFQWIEVDVNVTRDGVPVLFHDQYIDTPRGKIPLNRIEYAELESSPELPRLVRLEDFMKKNAGRLNMLIEIKNIKDIPGYLHISREISRIIKKRPVKNRIIIDSFNEYLPQSIKHSCDCETGYDMPYREKPGEKDLYYAKRMNFDWIYLHYSVIDENLLQSAHDLGLKVMAYTVNDTKIVDQWAKNELPDGIITDSIRIFEYFNKQQAQ